MDAYLQLVCPLGSEPCKQLIAHRQLGRPNRAGMSGKWQRRLGRPNLPWRLICWFCYTPISSKRYLIWQTTGLEVS